MALPYTSFLSWNLFGITIQAYGLFVAIAVIVGTIICYYEAKRKKEDADHIFNLLLWIVISAAVISRITHLMIYPEDYNTILDMLMVWKGGLTWYGAFFGGLLGVLLYMKLKKLNFLKYLDIIAPAIPIGHIFGRIGCVLGDGGHVGKLTSMPWGFLVNGEVRHVTAWYSIIGLIIVSIIIWKLRTKDKFDGFVFASYILLYSVMRFIVELFRDDPTVFGLTMAHWSTIILFVIFGIFMWIKLKKK